MSDISVDTPLFSVSECRRFIADCFKAVGIFPENAEAQADLLVEADYRGHYSHGMNRLESYINDVKKEACNPNARPKILKEKAATAWVDGCNGLGSVVGNFCMDLAIKKAKEVGVGWVVCRGSNHFGIVGNYSTRALKEGLIGMAFCNSSSIVVPTRAKDSAIGTCPLSIAASGKNDDSFVLDMATCTVALGKIEMQIRKNKPIPEGWALDENANPTTDPETAFKSGRILPLGGQEAKSGYKGYGLGLMVEIFTGIMSGSSYGPFVRKWASSSKENPRDLSHCFVAIDPESFAPMFNDRLQDLMNYLRNMDSLDKDKPVLIPGDPERIHMAEVDKAGGLRYIQHQIDTCNKLSASLNVKPLQPLGK